MSQPKQTKQQGQGLGQGWIRKDQVGWTKTVNNCSATVGPNGVLYTQYDGEIAQFARFKKIATVDYHSKAHIITLKDQSGAVMLTIGGPGVIGINMDQLYSQIVQTQRTFWAHPQ